MRNYIEYNEYIAFLIDALNLEMSVKDVGKKCR